MLQYKGRKALEITPPDPEISAGGKKLRDMIKDKIKTQKDLVKKLRAIRDKFNKDIQDMTLEEEQKYLVKMAAKWENSLQR